MTVAADRLRIGRIEISAAERRLWLDGRPADLGPRAFDLLLALVERRDRVVPKNELLEAVWPGLVVEEGNLPVQVFALRKLLGPGAIATIPGRGYRFTAAADGDDDERPATPAATMPRPGNLRPDTAPLYGRDEDLARIRDLLARHWLLTLTGPGGIGKTRLARAAAAPLADAYADGAWLVELASLADPALLPATIAHAVGAALARQKPAEEELVDALAGRRMLLVLDNCEHLIAASARLAHSLLSRARGVRLLVTSQEPLHLDGEQVYRVGPLAVPPNGNAASARQFGAVALFEARVLAADPRFALPDASLPLIVDICRRLDGMALAIELAAARVPLLGLAGVRERLDDRLRLLVGGLRLADARHQTLRATLEWSHGLLNAAERAVFRRLGVFTGGFSLEAAQQVGADATIDEWSVLDLLGALVDKSLVAASSWDPPRYGLLESARAFALEKLQAAGETEAWRRRHAEACARMFEAADLAFYGGRLEDDDWIARYACEIDNLRAAMAWAIDHDPPLALKMLACASRLVLIGDLKGEGTIWWQKLEAHIEALPPRLRGMVWNARVAVYEWAGEDIASTRNAVALFREVGEQRRLAFSLAWLGVSEASAGRGEAAAAAFSEARELERADWPLWLSVWRRHCAALAERYLGRPMPAGDLMQARAELERAGLGRGRWAFMIDSDLAQNALALGHYDEAVDRLTRLAERGRLERRDSHRMCWVLGALAVALMALERKAQAHAVVREMLPHMFQSAMLVPLAHLVAWHLADEGRLDDAARLAGAADAAGANPIRYVADARPQAMALLESAFAAAKLATLMAEGRRMDERRLGALVRGGAASGGGAA